ncbi:MAG: anti-sigma factor [Caldilineaceae bacterium]|nr:anti-sigma factor [Caldilineaceae bacterium]
MKLQHWIFPLLVTAALALSACGPAASAPTESETAAQPEAIATEEMASEEMAEGEMKEGDMAEATEEPMAEATEEPMAEADATATPEEEMKSDDMDSDEAMMGHTLSLEIAGLEDLGEGWAYEGWLIIDGAPVSTGLFDVDADGMLSSHDFSVDVDPATATAFVLTIEPSPDADPAPSAVHLLGGDIVDGMAELSVAHPAALGADFSAIDSSYILGIGALASVTADNSYRNGIWFDKLNLPALPAGWLYEGWVVGPDGPITTGRFADPNAMDLDGSGPAAGGPGTGPGFPGQDYLTPAIDLTTGYAAVISIEPEPDNSPMPFLLKPLVDSTIDDVGDHGSQPLESNLGSLPTGTVHMGMMQ